MESFFGTQLQEVTGKNVALFKKMRFVLFFFFPAEDTLKVTKLQ